MIGVEGRYTVRFNIGGEEDFLAEEDLGKFVIIEEAGNVLPTWEVEFTLRDDKILELFNEGNILQYTFGEDLDSQKDVELRILKKTIAKVGKTQYTIYLAGIFNALEYVSNCQIRSFTGKSGVEVIQTVVAENFGARLEFNTNTSSDNQTWIQPNVPNKRFVNDVWMHSYTPASFIAVGISSDGTFILKDIMKETVNEPAWNFILAESDTDKNTKDVVCDGDYYVMAQSGFINHWLAYGRTQSIRVVEAAIDSTFTPELQALTPIGGQLDRSVVVTKRVADFGLLNDNVHDKYWEAYYTNLSYLALFSSTKVVVSYPREMKKDMKVLDLVMFGDERVKDEKLNSEYSGLYFITKISRIIENRQFVTVVELGREAMGSLQGDLR